MIECAKFQVTVVIFPIFVIICCVSSNRYYLNSGTFLIFSQFTKIIELIVASFKYLIVIFSSSNTYPVSN